MNFAPLRIISGYSFLKSGLTIQKIINSIEKNKYYGAAIADNGNLYGIPSFIKGMEEIKSKYLIGTEIIIEEYHLCLYVINEDGYKNLLNISYLYQKGDLTLDKLQSLSSGLVGILATHDGPFLNKLEEKDSSLSRKINELSKCANKFYLGVEIASKKDFQYADTIREFASNYTYETIAFPKIRYEKKDDAIVIKIVEAIDLDEKITLQHLEGQEYFYSITNYNKIYSQVELENTIKVIDLSTFSYHQKRGELLHYPVENEVEYLKDLVYASLKSKGLENEKYIARVEKELEVIIEMGYCSYFLIVQDYVNYAKSHDILVGPARGSAASSLVAYLLNITEVDPLKYDLIFERFLNKDRKTMPDIDIDFMDNKRDDMVEYMREKYGQERVANIVTFQSILAKQALRDVARIYDIPTRHVDLLCKRLTNQNYDLRDSYRHLKAFKELVDSDKYFLNIVTLASKIEGLPRQSGLHAAGIILNNNSLISSLPVSSDFSNNLISQYEMHYLEEQGFLKMDFLGLRNLTIISNIVDLINKNNPTIHLDKKNIPYEEKEIFNLISSGLTMGIFQLESSGMKRAIHTLKPTCFNDIVALLALFRPGPMDSIPIYAARKEGKEKINYPSPDLKEILEPTYGIIVYQEQITQIAHIMANFSLSEADSFRRGVSKKDKDVISSLKDKFIKGATNNGYSLKIAQDTFEHIYKFANYGFNKAHSVGYAIIASRMAYLKLHYPLEFYACILESTASGSDSKFNECISEMKKQGLNILSPDINKSDDKFLIIDKSLLYPLSLIKGINVTLLNNILHERNANGLFSDFFDFVSRLYAYKISETQILRLINSGALDVLYQSRSSMRASTKYALRYAELAYDENGQMILSNNLIEKPEMFIEHDDPLENLDLEYEAIGIMLSNNPLSYKHDLLIKNEVTPIIDIHTFKIVNVAGIIKTKKIINTKKGTSMAFIKIFDETGELEITIFPEIYAKNISILEKNQIIIVKGHYEKKNNEINFIANEINLLEGE